MYYNVVQFHHCCKLKKIGAVLESDSNFDKSSQMFQYAVDDANVNILGGTDLKLDVIIEQLEYGREFTISRKVCHLLEVINLFMTLFLRSDRYIKNSNGF